MRSPYNGWLNKPDSKNRPKRRRIESTSTRNGEYVRVYVSDIGLTNSNKTDTNGR